MPHTPPVIPAPFTSACGRPHVAIDVRKKPLHTGGIGNIQRKRFRFATCLMDLPHHGFSLGTVRVKSDCYPVAARGAQARRCGTYAPAAAGHDHEGIQSGHKAER